MCIGVTYTLRFILGGIFINNKIHLIAIEVIKLLFIAVLIKIDYTFIFLLGFYPRILITIYMYICSMKLKHYDGVNIKTVIHIANKYEELYFVKTNDKRWYVANSDLSPNKISNFYGRDSFINFKTGVVSTGYNIKFIKFEFMLVYIFSVISLLFLGLDNYSFIIFNLCHLLWSSILYHLVWINLTNLQVLVSVFIWC